MQYIWSKNKGRNPFIYATELNTKWIQIKKLMYMIAIYHSLLVYINE